MISVLEPSLVWAHADDTASVQRFQSGDESAFIELYTRHIGKLRRFAEGIVKNSWDAEEIAQDTFVRVYKHIGAFRGDCKFTTWVYEICKRLAFNRLKNVAYRMRGIQINLDAPIGDTDRTISDTIAAPTQLPCDEIATSELADNVGRAMAEIPKSHREILTLRLVHCYSYQQIARLQNIEMGTVKSRVNRARDTLKRKMRKEVFKGSDV